MQQIAPVEVNEYYAESTDGILIEVFPTYVPERSSPAHKQFFYSYRVCITNNSDVGCRVIHRHWKIKDGNGKAYEIQGTGVIGEKPMIMPGEQFEYTSFCPLHSPYGNMRGKYQLINEDGERFWVSVPLFFFRPPQELIESLNETIH